MDSAEAIGPDPEAIGPDPTGLTQDRREQLRTDELKRMDDLYERIETGIDEGVVDLESGTKMLLNVSAARMALGDVGMYPGAF